MTRFVGDIIPQAHHKHAIRVLEVSDGLDELDVGYVDVVADEDAVYFRIETGEQLRDDVVAPVGRHRIVLETSVIVAFFE